MRSLNDGVCSCLSGKYNARLGICNDCHISCAECDGPDSNHCTECKDNILHHKYKYHQFQKL
jgi:hypothetical protein